MAQYYAISLIIPVLNEYQSLQNLVVPLIQNNKGHALELIVCDGGSSDLSCPYVRQLQHQYISHPQIDIKLISSSRGRAMQMNRGAEQASHEMLVFLHADTVLPIDWVTLIADKPWGRFNVRLSGRSFIFRLIEQMMNIRSCVTQVATGDQAIFVRKKLFQRIQGFPALPLMEDIAISKKLRVMAKISCIKTPLMTSSRRWENKGVLKTIVLMWSLRLGYFLGIKAQTLADIYYPNHAMARASAVVQVFTKLPILGYVKTRLIPHIGEQSATDIHRYLLQQTLAVVSNSQVEQQLWIAQEEQHKSQPEDTFIQFKPLRQQGDDLGERMGNAFKHGLKAFEKVMLIGTDCLDFKAEHITLSITALDDVDVVLTPVEDGGFISIACRVFDQQIFNKVAWGTEYALRDVLTNLERLSITYKLLEPVRDIDTYADVIEYPELIKLIK